MADRKRREADQDGDYVTSLRQRIHELEDELIGLRTLLECAERKERRLRIWTIGVHCPQCDRNQSEFIALVNRKVYHGPNYERLVQRLRVLGYFVKEHAFSEKPPAENKPFDGECNYLKPTDIRDVAIPDGIGPDEPLGEDK